MKLSPVLPKRRRRPAFTVQGKAQLLRSSASSFRSAERCLAAEIVVWDQTRTRLYFRAAEATPFRIIDDRGQGYTIAGPMEIAQRSGRTYAPSVEVPPDALRNLGISTAPPKVIILEQVVREGDYVEVSGTPSQLALPELSMGYRDGGMDTVLLGRPGRPNVLTLRGSGARRDSDAVGAQDKLGRFSASGLWALT